MNQTKTTHGGRREGSGRKHTGAQQVTLRLSPSTIARIKTRAKELRVTMSELVEKTLQRALDHLPAAESRSRASRQNRPDRLNRPVQPLHHRVIRPANNAILEPDFD
jgi:hypothetical protein